MRTPYAVNNELTCPAGFIETHGPSLAEEQHAFIDAYLELNDD